MRQVPEKIKEIRNTAINTVFADEAAGHGRAIARDTRESDQLHGEKIHQRTYGNG
jgi:hypothetical protein